MASPASLPRALLVYLIVIPLALFLGYLLTTPMDFQTAMVVSLVFLVLLTPVLIQSHQAVLIFAWNAHIVLGFLPGAMPLYVVMVPLSLGFTVLNRILSRETRLVHVPSVSWSLAAIALVVLLTAKLRGGIGFGSLGGGSSGGRYYVLLLSAIIGYWAISLNPIPLRKAVGALRLFYLSNLTAVVSNLALLAGPSFYFLYSFFPVDTAIMQYTGMMSDVGLVRIGGLSAAALGILYYLLARHGLQGLLSFSAPRATLVFLAAIVLLPMGGFRSALVGAGLTMFLQFFVEGLHRTKYLAYALGLLILGGALLVPLAPHLPLSVQRALSILPLNVDPVAKLDAKASSEWRFEMWRYMLPDLPNYFWVGRGLSMNLSDVYLAEHARMKGLARDFEAHMLAGNYHSGPLSLYVGFGMPGVVTFVWFLIVSTRLVYRNWRYGPPELRNVNSFILAYSIGHIPFFILVFGAFDTQMYHFTGPVALSVALNGGMRGPARPGESP